MFPFDDISMWVYQGKLSVLYCAFWIFVVLQYQMLMQLCCSTKTHCLSDLNLQTMPHILPSWVGVGLGGIVYYFSEKYDHKIWRMRYKGNLWGLLHPNILQDKPMPMKWLCCGSSGKLEIRFLTWSNGNLKPIPGVMDRLCFIVCCLSMHIGNLKHICGYCICFV